MSLKENVKRYIVSGLSGMLASMSLFMLAGSMGSVMAGEAGSEGTESSMEKGEDDNAFQVILPTDTEHVFDFIMDPQKLISQTNAAAYGGSTFEENGTLFFRHTDEDASADYSSSSDALVIANAGTTDIDIILTARISLDETEGIIMTDDHDFTDDTQASLYLALTDGEHTVAIDSEEGASITTMLSGVSGEDGTCSEYRFWLTGAVNEKGDWSEVTGAVPKVTVTWCVAPCKAGTSENTVSEEDYLPEDEKPSTVNDSKTEENTPETAEEPGETASPEESAGQEETKETMTEMPSGEGAVREGTEEQEKAEPSVEDTRREQSKAPGE